MSEFSRPLLEPSPIGLMDHLRDRWATAIAAGVALAAVVASPLIAEKPAYADTPQAVIGMPFTGKWGFDALRYPPYSDATSSHPSVHASYGFDWATDLYPTDGTDINVYGSSPQGSVTFKRKAVTDTCSSYGANIAGQGVTFDVLVNGGKIGEVKYDHIDPVEVGNNPIASGTKIGRVTTEPLQSSCFQNRHTHVQFENTAGNYACYVDQGNPGATILAANTPLGVIGSTNNGTHQACAGIPNSAPPNSDTDGDGIPNNVDSCPTQAGPASNNGCPIQGVQHVFTGETNGKINEIYWGTGNVGVTNSEKYTFGSPVTALANVLYNNSWHVYTGTAGGEVYETYWGNGNNNPTTWLLTDLNTPIDSMSVQITGNGLQHVYTGTEAGTINETYWGDIFGNNPATQQLVNVGSPVKALGSYFINSTQHVYSGTQDGKLRETYWGNGNNLTTWLVGTVAGSVASLDVKITGNGLQHIYSGTSAGKVYETYWGDIFGNTTATVEKASFASPVNSVSAQVDSNLTHIYSATNAGDVYETYWGNLSLATQQLAAIGAPVVRIASAITGNGLQHVYAATSDGRIYETYWGDSFGNTKTTWQFANVGAQVAGLVVRIT